MYKKTDTPPDMNFTNDRRRTDQTHTNLDKSFLSAEDTPLPTCFTNDAVQKQTHLT